MRRLLWHSAVGFVALAGGTLPLPRAAAQAPGAVVLPAVRAGVSVSPDTVTVGDPFVVRVRVQAPAGATVEFAEGPDSSGAVAPRDPRRVDTIAAPNGDVDVVATYRLSAWDVGPRALGIDDAVVRLGSVSRRVPLGAYVVFVRSVLPADSALRVPKAQRPPLPDLSSVLVRWWPWLLAAVLLLALVSWLVARWWRRRRNRRAVDDPYARARDELDRIEQSGLGESGEAGRVVALAADTVRDYLSARLDEASASLTSSEVLAALHGRDEVPHERLDAFLAQADLVKFAALRVGTGEAGAALGEARGVVDDVERGVREREAREAREADERRRRADDEARRYENARRRAARRDAA